MRVLLTGAAGKLGRVILGHLGARYDWILTDLQPPPETRGRPFIAADLGDGDALRALCRQVEAVVHLAAMANEKAAWQELWRPNIAGVYNLFEAACEAGCRRVVFASSLHAVGGHPPEVRLRADAPPCPGDLYGATKAWGEALAALYAGRRNLSVICLRLGWVMARTDRRLVPGAPFLDAVLTHEDLIRLVSAALEAPADMRYGIFPGISRNGGRQPIEGSSGTLLGYQPQDDAFVLARKNSAVFGRFRARRVAGRLRSILRRNTRRRADVSEGE